VSTIVIFLLMIIILFLVIPKIPMDIIFYSIFTVFVVTLIFLILVFANVFIHDPIGTIYNLIIHNPMSDFTTAVLNSAPNATELSNNIRMK
jgi:hypothetical protein